MPMQEGKPLFDLLLDAMERHAACVEVSTQDEHDLCSLGEMLVAATDIDERHYPHICLRLKDIADILPKKGDTRSARSDVDRFRERFC